MTADIQLWYVKVTNVRAGRSLMRRRALKRVDGCLISIQKLHLILIIS
jgi:hypothetical protein